VCLLRAYEIGRRLQTPYFAGYFTLSRIQLFAALAVVRLDSDERHALYFAAAFWAFWAFWGRWLGKTAGTDSGLGPGLCLDLGLSSADYLELKCKVPSS
jgi:hypothetical protein